MSVIKKENNFFSSDKFKWFLVFMLTGSGILSNEYYSDVFILYRIIVFILLATIVIYIGSKTLKGIFLLSLLKEARLETRKIIWPSRQEIKQVTITVVIAVTLMGLVLWGLDSFFSWLVSVLIGY